MKSPYMIPLLLFILLGVVQGILEWLPVSSEGQIFFLGTLFGISEQSLLLSVAFWLHFGTMISVLILFRKEWFEVLDINNPQGDFLRKFLVITTIGTAVTGIPIKIFLLDLVGGDAFGIWIMVLLAVALVITGLLLKFQKSSLDGERELEELSMTEGFIIGLAQGFTIIPGVSRSGTTVTAMLFANINGDDSFRGSFFMSVPAVLGAITLDLFDYFRGESSSVIVTQPFGIILAIGFAAIFGILTMTLLLKFARETDFSNVVLILAAVVVIYILLAFQL